VGEDDRGCSSGSGYIRVRVFYVLFLIFEMRVSIHFVDVHVLWVGNWGLYCS